MEEQANKILVELLQKAVGGIDAAVSFSQAQIPDVVHQLLVWNSVRSILFQVFAIILIVAAMRLPSFARNARKNGERWTAYDGRPKDDWFVSSFAYDACVLGTPISALVIGLPMIIFNFDWLKIWLAPKLYLLEYAASLIK